MGRSNRHDRTECKAARRRERGPDHARGRRVARPQAGDQAERADLPARHGVPEKPAGRPLDVRRHPGSVDDGLRGASACARVPDARGVRQHDDHRRRACRRVPGGHRAKRAADQRESERGARPFGRDGGAAEPPDWVGITAAVCARTGWTWDYTWAGAPFEGVSALFDFWGQSPPPEVFLASYWKANFKWGPPAKRSSGQGARGPLKLIADRPPANLQSLRARFPSGKVDVTNAGDRSEVFRAMT